MVGQHHEDSKYVASHFHVLLLNTFEPHLTETMYDKEVNVCYLFVSMSRKLCYKRQDSLRIL